MTATNQDLTIERFASFSAEGLVQDPGPADKDLTGWTLHGDIKRTKEGPVVTSFTLVAKDQGSNTGEYTIDLTRSQTALLAEDSYLYDIVIVQGTNAERVLEGTITVVDGVTNPDD